MFLLGLVDEKINFTYKDHPSLSTRSYSLASTCPLQGYGPCVCLADARAPVTTGEEVVGIGLKMQWQSAGGWASKMSLFPYTSGSQPQSSIIPNRPCFVNFPWIKHGCLRTEVGNHCPKLFKHLTTFLGAHL